MAVCCCHQTYLRCLDFCVALVQHAPPVVAEHFIAVLAHGFVIPVLRCCRLPSVRKLLPYVRVPGRTCLDIRTY